MTLHSKLNSKTHFLLIFLQASIRLRLSKMQHGLFLGILNWKQMWNKFEFHYKRLKYNITLKTYEHGLKLDITLV